MSIILYCQYLDIIHWIFYAAVGCQDITGFKRIKSIVCSCYGIGTLAIDYRGQCICNRGRPSINPFNSNSYAAGNMQCSDNLLGHGMQPDCFISKISPVKNEHIIGLWNGTRASAAISGGTPIGWLVPMRSTRCV